VSLTPTEPSCCEEYARANAGVSRRGLLRGMGVAAGAGMVATSTFGSTFSQTAYAAAGKKASGRVLVVVSLRGAADGMSLVVPHGDPVYYKARPRIAVPADRLLAADAMFGLHPSFAPLLPMWTSGKMAAIHATGLPSPNRSHFSAMEAVEDADPGSRERIGWLNRLVGRDGAPEPVQAVGFGSGVAPTSLMGAHQVLATTSVDSVRLAGTWDKDSEKARHKAMSKMWGDARGPLGDGARAALDVVDRFAAVRDKEKEPVNGAIYRAGGLADALRNAARVIRAGMGAELVTIDQGNWDHHDNLGTPDGGYMKTCADELAINLAAFFTELGPAAANVTLVTLSEFGRRTTENANMGLDHGYGNVMLAMGAGVNGGRYYGNWPGLTVGNDSDLLVTTDYRSVLSEIVTTRLGASTATVFPGFAPQTLGFMNGY
jgi:uncharacterized protein (DUF1501 family)